MGEVRKKFIQYKPFAHYGRNWRGSNFRPAWLWAQLFWWEFEQGRFCWVISVWGFLNIGEVGWPRGDCGSQRFGFRSFSYQRCLWDLAVFCVGSLGMDFSLRMNALQMGCVMTDGLKIQTNYLLEVNSDSIWNVVCKTSKGSLKRKEIISLWKIVITTPSPPTFLWQRLCWAANEGQDPAGTSLPPFPQHSLVI